MTIKTAFQLADLHDNHMETVAALLDIKFNHRDAREFAICGIADRLKLMSHAIDTVYTNFPEKPKQELQQDSILTATMAIHAFVINVFGCIDNIARVWVIEKGIVDNEGSPLKNRQIGLFNKKDNSIVRRSLPDEMVTYLKSLDYWYSVMVNFRHSLTHRIPISVTPYGIPEENIEKYKELASRIERAQIEDDWNLDALLYEEQKPLMYWSPRMVHSESENSPGINFHTQLLTDFSIVLALVRCLIVALKTP